jgi:hypothetical protein
MMKQDLQRIETTLQQLGADQPANAASASAGSRSTACSFVIERAAAPRRTSSGKASIQSPTEPQTSAKPRHRLAPPAAATVQPLSMQHQDQSLSLPKFKLPNFSRHRHSFNSMLPMGLVQEISTLIEAWQTELRQVLVDIQDLYAEGPIVNGWLDKDEATSPNGAANGAPTVDAATLRHAEGEELLQYVEQICQSHQSTQSASDASANSPANADTATSGYRLCSLDADGRLLSRPCPPEQLPVISMAIARYRKLRGLLNRKEQLEIRLRQSAEALVEVHSYLKHLT